MAFVAGNGRRMHPGDDLTFWCGCAGAADAMAALAIADPSKSAIPFTMRAVGESSIVMAIQAPDSGCNHNDIID